MSDASERNYRSQSEPIYRELHDTEQFAELRRRYRSFVLCRGPRRSWSGTSATSCSRTGAATS
ncbi:hypothetical protein QE405_003790 [Nocardioides zeae]|uniref:Uncharacterized protein n=1 Tax=Nocardioides zeae TaxID=1457234 RepID=A0AAJ1X352_9ACTN|nr:hypothetical protein [Nocardioides zeae]